MACISWTLANGKIDVTRRFSECQLTDASSFKQSAQAIPNGWVCVQLKLSPQQGLELPRGQTDDLDDCEGVSKFCQMR